MRDSKNQPSGKPEPLGAGGSVGEGQSGTPLHKPAHVRDRERVGAGGPVGDSDTVSQKKG